MPLKIEIVWKKLEVQT